MAPSVPVSVNILDREYRIACPEEEQQALMQAAGHLDRRMREIRDSGRVVGMDRISVLAALNITNEYLDVHQRDQGLDQNLGKRIVALRKQVDSALTKFSG